MKIIGNQKQRDFLSSISQKENIPHAFLFSGEDQIGKKKIALEFAENIFCGCGDCRICNDFKKGLLIDFLLIEEEEGKIKIEKTRKIQEFLKLKTYSARKKIVIVNDAHLLGIDSQNSILKTLEEPSDNSILILITNYSEKILDTIKSRVQRIDFSPCSRIEIQEYLIEKGANKEEAEEIAIFSSGKTGKAIEFLENQEKKELFLSTIARIKKIHKLGFEEKFEFAGELHKEPEIVNEVLDIFERFFRRLMLLKLFNKNEEGFEDYTLKNAVKILQKIQETKYYLNNTNTNKKLLLENLLIKI
jgi:DNA polymerase-3 subunit delta'